MRINGASSRGISHLHLQDIPSTMSTHRVQLMTHPNKISSDVRFSALDAQICIYKPSLNYHSTSHRKTSPQTLDRGRRTQNITFRYRVSHISYRHLNLVRPHSPVILGARHLGARATTLLLTRPFMSSAFDANLLITTLGAPNFSGWFS